MPTLTGYVDVWGKHAAGAIDHTGPTSYTTGGQTLKAASYGLRSLDFVQGSLSSSGTYFVRSEPVGKGSKTTYKLLWFVTATNAEVAATTNLSGETVRLFAFGG